VRSGFDTEEDVEVPTLRPNEILADDLREPRWG
jgi:hypothetical protein